MKTYIEMAEKSQIATTIEQSKRLLAAGIDPGSADMMWVVPETFDSGFDGDCENTPDPPASLKLQRYGRYCDTPAWSLSRLWDILSGTILGGWFSLGSDKSEDIFDRLVEYVENSHANH